MAAIEAESRIYRFGTCEVRVASREVWRDGEAVSLQPKAFDLLLFLIQNRDRAVNKDELLSAVWPGLHVSETALTRCVMKARRAIDDEEAEESAIKTVHGHGYRFAAALHTLSENQKTENASPESHPQTLARPKRRLLWPVGAAVVLVIVLAFAFLQQGMQSNAQESVRVAIMPMENATNDAGLDWASLGGMSFASHFLRQTAGVEVVPTGLVVRLTGGANYSSGDALALDPDLLEKLQKAGGASHVVVSRLERSDALLTLHYTVVTASGASRPLSIIGEKPITLARELAQRTLSILPGERTNRPDLRRVSDDDFVNEAYARGRDKQLKGEIAEARDLFKVAVEHEPENFWLRYEYALSTRMMGELDEAEQLLTELSAEAEGSGVSAQIVVANNALGILRWRRGNMAAAKELYQKALAAIEGEVASQQTGAVLVNLAIIAGNEGDQALKRRYLGRAVTAFIEAGFETPPAYVSNAFASLEKDSGNLAEAERHLDTALSSYRLLGDQRSQTFVLNSFGQLRQRQVLFAEAQEFFEQSLQIGEAINSKFSQLSSHLSLAEVKIDKGQYVAAEDHARTALSIAQDVGNKNLEATAVTLLGTANMKLRRLETAEGYFQQADELYIELDNPTGRGRQALHLARVGLMTGDIDGAVSAVARVLDPPEDARDERLLLPALILAGDAAKKAGQTSDAQSYFERALEQARVQSEMAIAARVAAQLGHLHLDLDDAGSAASYLGILSDINPNLSESLKLNARYAHQDGRIDEARQLMVLAKERAGDAWSQADEAMFTTLTSQK